MILIDYNGVAIGNFLAMKMQTDEDLLRHMVLNSIRMYRKKYSKEFGEIVVVADGTNNWRKRVFPQYKANRKKSRDKSDLDFNEIFRILNLVREEISANLPYKLSSRIINLPTCISSR